MHPAPAWMSAACAGADGIPAATATATAPCGRRLGRLRWHLTADADGDGICDVADNCTDVSGLQLSPMPANAACAVLDECGACGGAGIPAGDCDCDGNQLDACGVCGGLWNVDVDADGVCDNVDNCTDWRPATMTPLNNAACATAGCLRRLRWIWHSRRRLRLLGQPARRLRHLRRQRHDADADGICDNARQLHRCDGLQLRRPGQRRLPDCRRLRRVRRWRCACRATVIAMAKLEDALGVCGGTCAADVDGDGICDDTDNCTDVTACNYQRCCQRRLRRRSMSAACAAEPASLRATATARATSSTPVACAAAREPTPMPTASATTPTTAPTSRPATSADPANGACAVLDACGVCGGIRHPCRRLRLRRQRCGRLRRLWRLRNWTIDGDGLCDDADNCTDTSACNYDDAANGACAVVDACGVCGGDGIPAGDCDCNGNQLDAWASAAEAGSD